MAGQASARDKTDVLRTAEEGGQEESWQEDIGYYNRSKEEESGICNVSMPENYLKGSRIYVF